MEVQKKELNLRLIYTLLLVGCLSSVVYWCWETTRNVIKVVICSDFLHLLVWVLILGLYLFHYITVKSKEEEFSPVLTKSLPPILDNFFGAFTYIAIISTSLTLFKGLYLQLVFNEEYFRDFGVIDISFLTVVLFFLLWYSIKRINEDVNDAIWVEKSILIEEKPIIEQVTPAKTKKHK